MKNLKRKITQNKQHTARCTAAAVTDEIKWRWWWTKRMTETETTTMITATAAAAVTVTNWIKKFLCLNRVSKEIRIRIEIKSIYDEATCSFDMCLIKKEINEQKTATDELRLQSVCNRFFVVQQTHKMYSVICTHDSSAFTQQSHSDRIVCSALRTAHVIFFDLVFFLHVYQEKSSFFSIDLKEITIHDISMNLMRWWRSDDNDRTDAAVMTKEEV